MTLPRLVIACSLTLALSACAIPDLIAHGIKEYDKSRSPAPVQPAAAPIQDVPVQPAVLRDEPPPPVYSGPAGAVPRETITVETLPPR